MNVFFACCFTSLTVYFPLILAVISFVYSWMYDVLGRQGETDPPLHAGSGWHVSDGNVRHRRTWWRLMAMYSSVCAVDKWEACATERKILSFLFSIFWEPTVSHSQESEGRESEGRMMLCVRLHHWGRLFPPQHYSSVNLGLPIKRDHTANMKYTLCVEHLIKYWLQTYMNLPHQIEAPVWRLPLIRCVWYGNESRKQQGPLHTTYFLCC